MSDFINVTNEVAKATLADPTSAAKAAGKSLLADGVVYESDGVNWNISSPKSKRVAVSSTRLFGAVGKDTTAGRTAHLIMQAPAHFDAVRVNVLSAESAGNTWKVTVAPSAKYNTLGPVDASVVRHHGVCQQRDIRPVKSQVDKRILFREIYTV